MKKPLSTNVLPHRSEERNLPVLIQIGSVLRPAELSRLQQHLGNYGFSKTAQVTVHITEAPEVDIDLFPVISE